MPNIVTFDILESAFMFFKENLANLVKFDHETKSDKVENSLELEDKIVVLEDLIKSKDVQILKLIDKISEIEKKEFTNNFNDDYSDDDDEESETLSGSEFCNIESVASASRVSHHILRYHCDCCDFRTEHEVGLKIHKSKTHKYKCGNCNVHFKNEEQLVRHKSAEVILANLNKTCSEEYGLQVKQHLIDEKCLGVYNTNQPRDDKLPDLFLHSSECWDGSCY